MTLRSLDMMIMIFKMIYMTGTLEKGGARGRVPRVSVKTHLK